MAILRVQSCDGCPGHVQAWQEAVYPLLQAKLSTAEQGVSLYLTLYYGAAISNFLEVGYSLQLVVAADQISFVLTTGRYHPRVLPSVACPSECHCLDQPGLILHLLSWQVVLYHEHACEALSDDVVLELCDWSCRKALALPDLVSQAAASSAFPAWFASWQGVSVTKMSAAGMWAAKSGTACSGSVALQLLPY